MDTEWGCGKRRTENESRCLEGGRGERVEMGGMPHLEYRDRSYLMFVYLDIDSLCSSISPSIPHFTPLPTHTLVHTLFQWLSGHPMWSSQCPLLLYFASPSPFNIKPLTLCGKWAHSPIQCLLRHDVSEFYIKTDKTGLGCRSGWKGRSNALRLVDVGKERVNTVQRWCLCKLDGAKVHRGCSRQQCLRWGMKCCGFLRFASLWRKWRKWLSLPEK